MLMILPLPSACWCFPSQRDLFLNRCLRNVFGANSGYNIGKIITQDYKSDGSRDRPYETVLPLSQDLGLTIDHVCGEYRA